MASVFESGVVGTLIFGATDTEENQLEVSKNRISLVQSSWASSYLLHGFPIHNEGRQINTPG